MEYIDFDQLNILGLVALAMILGGALGYERETVEKPAGLRTHTLVAGSAALLVALGNVAIQHFDLDTAGNVIRSDPIRIVEAVITGISFLGAGTIIYHRSNHVVEGLTTAASLLIAAGIGLSVGLSQFFVAIGVTLLALLTLRGISLIENYLNRYQ